MCTHMCVSVFVCADTRRRTEDMTKRRKREDIREPGDAERDRKLMERMKEWMREKAEKDEWLRNSIRQREGGQLSNTLWLMEFYPSEKISQQSFRLSALQRDTEGWLMEQNHSCSGGRRGHTGGRGPLTPKGTDSTPSQNLSSDPKLLIRRLTHGPSRALSD